MHPLAEHDVATPTLGEERGSDRFPFTFFHHAAKALFFLEITVYRQLEESNAPMRREIAGGDMVTLVSCLSFIRVERAESKAAQFFTLAPRTLSNQRCD
jgi:hypothetical protein